MTSRVFPIFQGQPDAGLRELREHGLPPLVQVVDSPHSQQFYDFQRLATSREPLHLASVEEPLLTIGVKCFRWPLLEVRSPDYPVAVGLMSGRIWFLEAGEAPCLMNSGAMQMLRSLEITKDVRTRLAAERAPAALRELVAALRSTDPAVFDDPRSYWSVGMQGLAIDFELDWPT
jgi:hypothetical protein